MTRLDAAKMHDARGRRRTGKEWLDRVRRTCPDVETAPRVSLISRSEGAVSAESWPALPYENYLEALGEVAGGSGKAKRKK